MGNAGAAVGKQAKDANGNVCTNVFFSADSRHVVIQTGFGTVCSQITGLNSATVGEVRLVEITGTVAFHYKPATTKAAVSGSLMTGDNPFCPANVPKIINIGDNSFIGVRGAAGVLAGTLHITLLL